ncbi:MAG TPA: heavy metal-binding domain-containing protein [Solirubrobacteraceae bacterium]|nr:heavy metal-binding domain-containing protein [Solirubrobacteraceae bacterium]
MGFLKRDDDNQPAPAQTGAPPGFTEEAPHAATYEAGSLAGIPESGRERIARMKQEVARGFFTSDLSVDEFLLVKQAGFDPVGLVLGSSIYHIGFQQAMWNQSQELGVLTQAMYHARELAMTRMEEEADQLGADGIVGVRLDIGRYEWGADLAEFISVGTAVKHRGGELHRAPTGRPFTSDLSGQDFAKLLRAGYRPVGLVMGNCVYHVGRQGMLASLKQVGRNVEMPNYTQALYEARELAMERMQNEADELQAGGIVGARIVERSHGWGSHVIEFFAIGTAVVPTSDEHVIEKPAMVLPLTG